MDKNQVYVILGVDTETDVGSFTPFYEGVKNGVPKLLEMFDRHQVKGTFFFTGEAAKMNPEIAKMVAHSTSEVGCHALYHETVGDELFPLPDVKPLLPHEVFPRWKSSAICATPPIRCIFTASSLRRIIPPMTTGRNRAT